MAAHFRLLGPVEAVLEERPVALGQPKQRALLAVLLLERGRVVPAERLVDALWGDDPPASAVRSLQVYVHGLRRALGRDRIETAGRGYRAVLDDDDLDLERFERALDRGRAALAADRPDEAADELRQALGLWRGPALADLPEETRRALETERLEGLRLTALELRNDAELACGRHDAIVAELESLVSEHPYRERFLEQRVLALYRCGRQAEALEAYRTARRVLSEELGLEPSPALQELERAILRQEPALAAPVAPPRPASTLPAPATPLVGRRLEIAAVGALIREEGARLVTLTGPGGTGKTRLALAVAHELEPELRDGALFVRLAPVASPDLLAPTIAEALGVLEGERPLPEGIAEHLRSRRMLLLLDNFEQLLAAAPTVGDLLAAAPHLIVLATSRAPLRLAAEHEYPVSPFEPPDAHLPFEELVQTDALRLFIARARAVDPAFELDEPGARDVARICVRLDGLPLAIELAAARSKLLAPAEMLDRLEREPHLFGTGPRDAPARQRTLAATIRWSYDLLGEDERLAFARLGVFSGGCTLEAAERVCEVTLDVLSSLVDNNLLRRRDGRFTMLETVRHFAVERLEEAGAAGVRLRHAEWLTELAETAEQQIAAGEDATALLDRLQAEHANIRAALAWSLDEASELALRLASALRVFWEVRGHFGEGGRWLDEALARAPDAEVALRIKAISVSGTIAFHHGDLGRAGDRFEAALVLARQLGDDRWLARSLSDVGTVAAAREDFETASALLERSAALCREIDEPLRLAIVLRNLGHIAGQRGDYAHAIAVTEEALALEAAHKPNSAIALYNLGSYCLDGGDLQGAREWLERCVALTFELGYKEVMAYALASYVRICLREGDAARAAHLAGTADRLLADAGVVLQAAAEKPFEEAKATAAQQLGDAYAVTHEAAMASPLEEALRQGAVLAETPASS